MLICYRVFLMAVAVVSLAGTVAYFNLSYGSGLAPICLVLSVGFLAVTDALPGSLPAVPTELADAACSPRSSREYRPRNSEQPTV